MAQQKEARLVRRSIACNTCGWETGLVVWSDSNYKLVACEHCRLVSLDPLPEAEHLAHLYDEAYYHKFYISFAEKRRAYFRRRLISLIKRGAGGRLLDVGCGPGFFLAEAMAAGFAVHGVEPALYAAAYASTVLGIPVDRGTLPETAFPDHSFDVVTFWDVIGHIRNPHETIEEAVRILAPGGMVAVKVPIRSTATFRFARLLGRGAGARELLLVPSVIHHYTFESLSALLKDHGLYVTGRERVNEPKVGRNLTSSRWKNLAMQAWMVLRHMTGFKDSQIVYARKPER